MKGPLWQLRFDQLKITESAYWSIKDLKCSIKSLKNNKTHDPSGLMIEIFKAPVIGQQSSSC